MVSLAGGADVFLCVLSGGQNYFMVSMQGGDLSDIALLI